MWTCILCLMISWYVYCYVVHLQQCHLGPLQDPLEIQILNLNVVSIYCNEWLSPLDGAESLRCHLQGCLVSVLALRTQRSGLQLKGSEQDLMLRLELVSVLWAARNTFQDGKFKGLNYKQYSVLLTIYSSLAWFACSLLWPTEEVLLWP